MCGRFVRSSSVASIADEFDVAQASVEMPPSFNISPTQDIVILKHNGLRQLVKCRWGFIPSGARNPSTGSMINARAETVASKQAFKSAVKKQRCLVIADGFYEWLKTGTKKTPVYISLKTGKTLGFAGLYNPWISPAGERICTCAIITTASNKLLAPLHDRMPAIIPKDKEDLWLNPCEPDLDILLGLLRPFPSEELKIHEVSSKVNYSGYDSPDTTEPVYSQKQDSLY
jgi:putative SOS response-associated peptidase YedK